MKKIILKDGTIKNLGEKTEFMGIINVTPDSFFENSRAFDIETAVNKAALFIEQGAFILDIGGESTRPGAEKVDVTEEINRVIPVIQKIRKFDKNILISIDTRNSETARQAISAGADIINDISGLNYDSKMIDVVIECNVPVILMHMSGSPENMQNKPYYENVVQDVYNYLFQQIEFAKSRGINEHKIIIDLGIGFGKTKEHNIELLRNIDFFDTLGYPHLLAGSRKTFIGKILEKDSPNDRLFGTIGLTCYGVMKNIEIIRVHDVQENIEAARMFEVLKW